MRRSPKCAWTCRTCNYVYLGTEYSSHANKLNQDIVQVSDDLTMVKGHAHVHVRHAERVLQVLQPVHPVPLRRLPIQQHRELRERDRPELQPQLLEHVGPRTGGRVLGHAVRVLRRRQVAREAELHAHLRRAPRPAALPGQAAREPDRDDATSGTRPPRCRRATMFSPRVGFNWDLSGTSGKRRQIRGGIGQFVGRTPYVWLSNQYGNTGLDFTSLSVSYNANNKIPFVADPNAQPTSMPAARPGRQTINLVDDPNYQYPTVIRGEHRARPRPRVLRPRGHRRIPVHEQPEGHLLHEPQLHPVRRHASRRPGRAQEVRHQPERRRCCSRTPTRASRGRRRSESRSRSATASTSRRRISTGSRSR